MLAAYDHPELGRVQSVGVPLRVAGYEPAYRPAPALAGDAPDLLTELGYSVAEIATLAEAGAFGPR